MKLIAIVGPSGSGKDTVARMLSEETDIPVVVSFTTRPMREGEQNGREHFFVSAFNVPQEKILAYTKYGDYEYWTEISQIQNSAIYVIDEHGLLDLHNRFPYIDIISIYVSASEIIRQSRGVTSQRIMRDNNRFSLPNNYFNYRISNNKSIVALHYKIVSIVKQIQNEKSVY